MIRRATEADLPEMRRVFDAARAYMAAQGNPNQWEPGYPTDEVLRGDMARGGLHVLADDTGIYGAFAFLTGDDPTYAEIDGAWLSDRPYATIHRVASDGTHRGVFAEVMAFAIKRMGELDQSWFDRNPERRSAAGPVDLDDRGDLGEDPYIGLTDMWNGTPQRDEWGRVGCYAWAIDRLMEGA